MCLKSDIHVNVDMAVGGVEIWLGWLLWWLMVADGCVRDNIWLRRGIRAQINPAPIPRRARRGEESRRISLDARRT